MIFHVVSSLNIHLNERTSNQNSSMNPSVTFTGPEQRLLHVGALWKIQPERSLPGAAEGWRGPPGLRSRQWGRREFLTETPGHLWGGGGSRGPSGGPEAGGGTLQKDAGEDAEAAGSCRVQTQEGEFI